MADTLTSPATAEPANESRAGFFPLDDTARRTNCVMIDWIEPLDVAAYWVLCAFLLVCGGILAFSGWEDYVDAVRSPYLAVLFPLGFLILAVAIPPMLIWPAHRRRRRAKEAIGRARALDDARELSVDDGRIILAHAVSIARIGRSLDLGPLPKLPLLYFELAQYGLSVPRIILDRRVSEAILAIHRPADLIEPEPISSRGARALGVLSLFSLPAAVGVSWFLGWGSTVLTIIAVLAALGFVLEIVRWVRSGVRPGESGAVAGVGYVEFSNGARVGSWQVVTIISKARLQRMRVRILAPTWNHELAFLSPADPGFIAFWQRWNHPHPRPELVEDRGGV